MPNGCQRDLFGTCAQKVSCWMGSSTAFMLAVMLVVGWALAGPLMHYSEEWQLLINTTTTIGTFLMVFLIQNTQNRDMVAMQLKLAELIRATEGAHLAIMNIEDMNDDELDLLRGKYMALADRARERMKYGAAPDTGQPEIHL